MSFQKNVLKLVPDEEVERICNFIQNQTFAMKRKGAVIGLSGGVDSSLAACLTVKALGKDRVFGLILPEKESNPSSKELASHLAKELEIAFEIIDITSVLDAFGTYGKRDELVKKVFPDYGNGYTLKLTLPPDLLDRDALNFFTLTIENEKGQTSSVRLKKDVLNGIIAATDTKQRIRMIHLYYYAEKMNYLVCGTTNKTETIQGFFVKYGDGGVDIEPIAHLFKTQVYQLASYLDVPEAIIKRPPSPDTFSFFVSDEDFFFRIPYNTLDALLYSWINKVPVEEICHELNLSEDQVLRAFRDFRAKHKASQHLRELPPSPPG